MKLMYETPDNQAGEVVEREPTETGGPTLSEALAELNPSLAVEPVEEAEEIESEAEEAPGDEVVEEEETQPGTEELELEAEAEETVEEAEEAEEEVEEEKPEVGETFTLTVGEVELDLEVEDESTRAALVEMQNDLSRVRDVDSLVERAQVDTQKNQQDAFYLQQVEDELRMDPAGYIAEKVHPSVQVEVAKALLFNDEVLQAVEDTISGWLDDPAKRRVDHADRKIKRVEMREQFQAARDQQKAEQDNAKAVIDQIMKMTPDGMDHQTAKMWHTDAIGDLQQHVRHNNIEALDPEQVPQILAARMRLYGIGTNARVVRAQPANDRGDDLAAKLKDAKATPERIRKRVSSRSKVATAPSGAGGAPGRTQVRKGATLDEVLKDMKQRVRQ